MSESVKLLFFIFIWLPSLNGQDGGQAVCTLTTDASQASATVPNSITTHSCTPCNKASFEVHAINFYQPTGSVRGFQQKPTEVKTVPVYITSYQPTSIKLVFMSYEAAHWLIRKSSTVTIQGIALFAYYNTYSSVRIDGEPNPSYSSSYKYIGRTDTSKIVDTVKSSFGFITSYTGVYHTSAWNLTVGTCRGPSVNGLTTFPTRIPARTRAELITSTPILPHETRTCVVTTDMNSASATHPNPSAGGYKTYSCTPCNKAGYEVHVLNIYQPYGRQRLGGTLPTNVKTVPVYITSVRHTSIKLVLISYEAANWLIKKQPTVTIQGIALFAYYNTYSSVMMEDAPTQNYISMRDYISGWRETAKMEKLVKSTFGFLTSYTGVYETLSWNLTVGTCHATMAPDNDNCSPNPCLNSGTCSTLTDKPFCSCTAGYTGTLCEITDPDGISTVVLVAVIVGVLALVIGIVLGVVCAYCRRSHGGNPSVAALQAERPPADIPLRKDPAHTQALHPPPYQQQQQPLPQQRDSDHWYEQLHHTTPNHVPHNADDAYEYVE